MFCSASNSEAEIMPSFLTLNSNADLVKCILQLIDHPVHCDRRCTIRKVC